MPFFSLAPSPRLQIFRYGDVDHFRNGLSCANVDFLPLGNFRGPLGQAVLSLPGCNIFVLRTFPRIVKTILDSDCSFIFLSMTDDARATILNGKEVMPSSLGFARGPLEYRAVEKDPGYYAAIVFSPPIEDRGWPEVRGKFLTIQIPRQLELDLRISVFKLFQAMSTAPDFASAAASLSMRASFLDKLDQVFDDTASIENGSSNVLKALKSVDDFIDSRASAPIYSEEIAAALGVSVRSLTNLMVRANGMSLQRYLRLRRLWSVRRQLLTGNPQLQIKAIALANGFWHMGDFAAKYAREFGELPSSTHARATAGR
jgi:AraC family ethanolamine operon transcriptional activator